jgi:hypothetical protein
MWKWQAPLTTSSIPDITEKIRTQLLQVDDELSRLPETPKDKVQHIVRQHLTKFSLAAKDLLDGTTISRNNKFHSEWKRLYGQFQKATEVMRPGCVFTTPFDMAKVVINIDDSDDEGGGSYSNSSFTTPAKRPQENGQDLAQKRQKFNIPSTPTRLLGTASVKNENGSVTPQRLPALRKFKQSEFGPFYQDYLGIGQGALTLLDIRQSVAERGPAGIPEFDNHKIREDYALVAVNPWKFPLETFVDHTFRMLRLELLSTLRSTLQSYEQTSLYRRSKDIIEKFLQKQEIEQRAISMEFYKTEAAGLFTINEAAFDLHKAEALEWLKKQRRNWRLDCYMKKQSDTRFKDDAAREAFKNKVTDAELGPDPFAKELDIAAYIRGYYTTARLRFVDSICANMKSRYFGKIKEEISYLLENKLGLDQGDSKYSKESHKLQANNILGEGTCQQLLEGNAEIAIKRTALQKKRKQLVEFSSVLDQLNSEIYDPEVDGMEDENFIEEESRLHPKLRRQSSANLDDDHMSGVDENQFGSTIICV